MSRLLSKGMWIVDCCNLKTRGLEAKLFAAFLLS